MNIETLEDLAFGECPSVTALLVEPDNVSFDRKVDEAAAAAAAAAADDDDADDADDGDGYYGGQRVAAVFGELLEPQEGEGGNTWAPMEQLSRVWAPNKIIRLLTGRFEDYTTFAALPRAMRAAPDATTWAGVQLWQWFSPPTAAGYNEGDGRVVCRSRHCTLFATMLCGHRTAKSGALLRLPQELWVVVFGLLRHDQPPVYKD